MLGAEKTNTRYVLPDSLDFQQLRKEIHLTYAVRRQAASGAAYTLFDTFDWRLYRKHKILTREGDRISLTSIEPSGPPLQAAWPKRRPPKFWWDFGESGLRSRLRGLIDVRALLPLMSVTRAGSRLRILNEDQKTVLSLFFMTYTGETVSGARQRALRLEIQPVLGY